MALIPGESHETAPTDAAAVSASLREGYTVPADANVTPEGVRCPAQWVLTVSYDGERFSGFARQPGQLTVQGNIEEALSLALRRPVTVTCAGRTDAGVHALGQVVNAPAMEEELLSHSPLQLKRSLNALTDECISVKQVCFAPASFSARFDALKREYRYFIVDGSVPPMFLRRFSWHVRRPLDEDAMREAATYLVGEHDFKSFCMAASAVGKNTRRFLERVDIERVSVMGENALCVTVVGNAFLHSMVRTIVGTLVSVGSGQHDAPWVGEVLAACDRGRAGQNAPAAGLVFWEVSYPANRMELDANRAVAAFKAAGGAGVRDTDVCSSGSEVVEGCTLDDDADFGAAATEDPYAFRSVAEMTMEEIAAESAAEAMAQPRKGHVLRREMQGPSVEGDASATRVAPADPLPAQGEPSFTFGAPVRQASKQESGTEGKTPAPVKKGPFSGLFGSRSRTKTRADEAERGERRG